MDGVKQCEEDEQVIAKGTTQLANQHSSHSWVVLLMHASIMGGREFLYAVEIVLVTPIILQLGMPENIYSFMWCFSPVIGVLVGPILGSKSDSCSSSFGRRRPFILALSAGALIGLTLLIFSKDIVQFPAFFASNGDKEKQRLWGLVVGILGAQSMDFCLDQSETPMRAYTLDVCSLKDQRRAFTLQTAFIGIGGAFGFFVDGIDWEETIDGGAWWISQTRVVYIFALISYIFTIVLNLTSIKETPLRSRGSSVDDSTTNGSLKNCRSKRNADIGARINNNDKSDVNKSDDVALSSTVDREPKKGWTATNGTYGDDSTNLQQFDAARGGTVGGGRRPHMPRALAVLPRIHMHRDLYLSMSCPSGLNKKGNDDARQPAASAVSSSSSGSLYDDSTASPSSCHAVVTSEAGEERGRDASFSFPDLSSSAKMLSTADAATATERDARERRSTSASVRHTWTPDAVDLIDAKDLRELDPSATAATTYDCVFRVDVDDDEAENCELAGIVQVPIGSGDDVACEVDDDDDAGENTRVLAGEKEMKVRREDKKRKKRRRASQTKRAQLTASEVKKKKKETLLGRLWRSIVNMPSKLRCLCMVELFGSIGMETLLLWYTDFFGRVVYGGDPKAGQNTTELNNYNAGVKTGCWGLTVYSVAMVLCSVFLERFRILQNVSIRLVCVFGFTCSVISATVMFVFPRQVVVLSMSGSFGITYAIMLTVPYVLLGRYHQDPQYVCGNGRERRGYGMDCAMISSQIYAANVVAAALSSPVISLVGTVKAMLLMAAFCYAIAMLFCFFCVSYPDLNPDTGEEFVTDPRVV